MPHVRSQGDPSVVNVCLWLAEMYEVDASTLATYQSWLSLDEQRRYEGFLHERRRREFIVGRGLARRALARELRCAPAQIEFEAAEQGKLTVRAPTPSDRIHFNITHTADYVGCVTCRDHWVGVDVEKLDNRVSTLDIAKRFFSAAEYQTLQGLTEDERINEFFTVWTLKEALAKAYGLGLAAPLESSHMHVAPPSRIDAVSSYPPFSGGAWLAWCSPTPRHSLAIGVLCDESAAVSIRPQAPENPGDVGGDTFVWATGRLKSG